ncbi:phosphate starvation-inducible protein PhoH [Ruminococcaceae bacterium YRB3002]|nr:phosphate starvation-inducible protein PhoH [Ruminococcaceae bacterium YRB3002]
MENIISDISAKELATGDIFRLISEAFDVACDTDGRDVIVKGDVALNVVRASDALKSLSDLLSDGNQIDRRTVDYMIYLAGQGKIEEFMRSSEEVFYTTPTGRQIRAKTLGQRIYLDSIRHHDLVICSGPAGSGKTFLSVAMAVKAFRNREVSRIILTRPALEAGERLGFLPGDIEEKVNPYMRPIYDALNIMLGEELALRYYEKGLIEVSPLAFMRGRNLDDCFVILDEAQNTTTEQMKMFLTRLGINCKACVCGDFTQIDLPRGIKDGLHDAIDVVDGVEGIKIVSLHNYDIVRNSLVQRIVEAYENRGSL